jgi:hypothetical protein
VTRSGSSYGYGNAILDIRRDGRTVASIERGSTDGYRHSAYTFTPDGQTIVSGGGNGVLSAYDLRGRQLARFVGHESDVWAVTPSLDGHLLVSGSSDQTLRLWNLKTAELISTLFHGTDDEWVMWTPQGYYTGSPGADKIVGWQINNGADQAADYIGAEQLRQHLNRPDIVDKAITLASAQRAAREAPGTSFQLSDLLARPMPRFRILSPSPGSTERGGRTTVKIAIEATSDPVKLIRVQVNGRQVDEETPDIGSGGFAAGVRILDVPLAKGKNEVRIALTSAIGEKAATLSLIHEGDGDLDKFGTLYILAIGVDRYPGLSNTCGPRRQERCDLKFAGADVRAVVDAVEKRLGPSHTRVVKRLLVNSDYSKDAPTASNILDAIDILKQARETDTLVTFIAGRTVKESDGRYRFLPTNAELAGETFRPSTVIPWQVVLDTVESAKGRRVLFLDMFPVRATYNDPGIQNAVYHANIFGCFASGPAEGPLDDAKLGGGSFFAYALVEALKGKSVKMSRSEKTAPSDGRDAFRGIGTYLQRRVTELSNGAQSAYCTDFEK